MTGVDRGLPEERDVRRWLRFCKRTIGEQRRSASGVAPGLVAELERTSGDLHKARRYGEALDTIDLALEGVRGIRDQDERTTLSYMAWKSRAFIASWMGLWRESVDAYRRAISFGDRGPYESAHPQSGPGDTRELSSMHFRVGDYAEGLSLLEETEERLRRYEPKLHPFVRDDERARTRAARSLVHLDLGEYERAEACPPRP